MPIRYTLLLYSSSIPRAWSLGRMFALVQRVRGTHDIKSDSVKHVEGKCQILTYPLLEIHVMLLPYSLTPLLNINYVFTVSLIIIMDVFTLKDFIFTTSLLC